MQQQPPDRHVVVALRQIKIEHLVDLVYLQPGRKDIFVVGNLLGNVFRVVVLILDISEDFLDNILQRNDTAGTAKLIHDDAEAFLLLQKHLHEFLCRHRLRNERHLADVVLPVFGRPEHLGRMDIPFDMVNILFIDDDLGVPALNEHLLQLFQRTVLFDCIDLRTRHHTVAHLRVLEIQRILKDLHLIFNIIFILRILDRTLHKIVQVDLRERAVILFLIHLHPHHAQENTCKECGKATDRPQNDEKEISQRSEEGQQPVGIALEQRLRQELTGKEDDQCGGERIQQHTQGGIKTAEERRIKNLCEQDSIDDQHDVVAHEHRRDKSVGIVVKDAQTFLRKSVLLLVHLCQKAVAGHKGDFHSREECGKHHRNQDSYD